MSIFGGLVTYGMRAASSLSHCCSVGRCDVIVVALFTGALAGGVNSSTSLASTVYVDTVCFLVVQWHRSVL